MAGTMYLVVGPSGAGKDTLLDGARQALAGDARYVFARRAITRPADAGGEEHDSVTSDEFARRRERGDFMVSWSAHGLDYGLPLSLRQVHDLTCAAEWSQTINTGSNQIPHQSLE